MYLAERLDGTSSGRSPGSPGASRSAATSSTPTRSRSSGPSRAGGPSEPDAREQPRLRDPAPPGQGAAPLPSSALILYAVLVGPLGVPASAELALLCWLSGAAFILLVETSPI